MRGFKFYNNLFGWIAGLIAFIVYQLTLEESVSLWDCGEFISASYKLMVVHPPGAPFFLLVGRIFSMFASEPAQVAFWVNTMSAFASALAVVFTFWIITYFAKKLLDKQSENGSLANQISIFGAGFVGALALTFMDSFWFSAVEAEVYAMSSFFTMITFWAALKWEQSNSQYADRWLVLIGLLIGISIGTHLLSLLVIPAVAFIYYFKKTKQITLKGGIIAFVAGFAILTFIQNIMIPGIPKLMTIFDLLFVNTLGFSYNTGSLFAVILIAALVITGIIWSKMKQKVYVNFAFVCLAYILLGYSSYAMVVIRSSANPPIDMNNPADPFNLLSYINREQYGDRPLLYGPYFTAENADIIDVKKGSKIYTKADGKYEQIGVKQEYVYNNAVKTFLPRMGDLQKDNSPAGYRYWSGMADVQNQIESTKRQIDAQRDPKAKEELAQRVQQLNKQKPTFANNISYFVRYQLGHMYFRYFMWNFAGRQNDLQGHFHNKEFEGNWISGIGFIDQMRLGPQKNLPEDYASNKARNTFFFLPLILGILGMVFQYKFGKNDFVVNLVFFLYTGILIIVFLNMPPYEPRERDYAIVGSFQVFCIWIGLGVLMLANWLKKINKNTVINAVGASVISLLAVPVVMGAQGWDDHDRSGRRLAIDFAINYLESCAPNAILFTNGDNDTYPLWYAQNVEGIRTDIRIINMSLLPTDWYSSILLDKVYDSEPLPLSLTKEDLRAGRNDYVRYMENPKIDNTKVYNLDQIIRFVTGEAYRERDQEGNAINYLPAKNYRVPVDRSSVIKNNVVPLKDTNQIVLELLINFNKAIFHKGDMVFFDLIAENAKNGWERPIYFTTTTGSGSYYGLEKYFQLEGLAYRLVPIQSRVERGMPSRIADDILYTNIMDKFKWFNMKEKENFFMDEKALLVPQNLQFVFIRFANELATKYKNAETELNLITNRDVLDFPDGREEELKAMIKESKERGINLLDKAFLEMPESVLLFSNQAKYFAILTYNDLGEKDKALMHLNELYERTLKAAKYYAQFEGKTQFTNFAISQFNDAVSFLNLSRKVFEDLGQSERLPQFDQETQAVLTLARKLGLLGE